jgi:hypothetical protein
MLPILKAFEDNYLRLICSQSLSYRPRGDRLETERKKAL